MKQLNPRLSRSRHLAFITRIVFLVTLVAGIVFVTTRGNFGSRAEEKTATATQSGDNGRNTLLPTANAAVAKASTLAAVCTPDPIVANNSDSDPGSLRQAIADACDASTITFNMATVTSPITLTTAELSINKNLTITGPGSSTLTIARSSAGGTPNFRIFNIGSGTVNISGITVTNGTPTDASPDGGGIMNSSTLALTDVTVSGNTAGLGLPSGATGGQGGNGGGIYNGGTLTMINCSVNGNTGGQGGVGGSAGGVGGEGGGICNTSNLTMTNCSVNGNTAGKGGTGVAKGGDGGWGGALVNRSSLSMTSCVISGNNGGFSGDGGGPVSGGSGGGIEAVAGTATLTGVTIINNNAGDTAGNGGGGNGGGIDIVGTGVMTLVNSTVSGNESGTSAMGGPGFGGGISTQSVLYVIGSTISDNTTGYVGGGIVTHNNLAVLKMTNSTVSGNHAPGSGGGIYDGGGYFSLANSTITNNSFTGLSTEFGAMHTRIVRNSIIAGNGGGADVENTFTSQGNNLIGRSDGSNGFTNGVNGDQVGSFASQLQAQLGPLANNGGLTQTHALLGGSPALDAGADAPLTTLNGAIDNVTTSINVTDASLTPSPGFTIMIDSEQMLVTGKATNTLTVTRGVNGTPAAAHSNSANVLSTFDQRGPGFLRRADSEDVDAVAAVDIGAYEVQSILVTNTADSGAGSLRQAITDANVGADTNAINFQPGLTGTISLLSALPDFSTSMSISGPGANLLTVQRSTAGGTPNFRIFTINSGKTISISGLTITNGRLAGANINNPDNGGGIRNQGGTLNLSNSNISGNSADHGGGIFSEGTLNVTNSTFSGNSAGVGSGGGIYNNSGTLSVTNSTFSGNSATNGFGGGILIGGSSATFTNCTVTGNSAVSGGGIDRVSLAATLRNTIVALNAASTGPDLLGTFSSQGHNVVGSTSGATIPPQTGDKFDAAASPLNLGPLANNGGPTFTHAPLPGSTAIDAGDNCVVNDSCSPAVGSALTTDQRGAGFNRSVDGNGDGTATVDIGAYEVQAIVVTNTADTGAGSLRQAITDANINADTNAIIFQPGLTGTIALLTALPDLSTSMSINGPGANQMIVQRSTAGGTPEFRIFTINTGKNVSLSGLTISNGISDRGAGISNNGNLTVINSTISGNSASNWGGGIYNDTVATLSVTQATISGNFTPNAGAGIANFGNLTAVRSTIAGNSATGNGIGGGIWSYSDSILNVTQSTISANSAANGGGIYSNGALTLTNTTLSGNTATTGGGGGLLTAGAPATATLTNVTITDNHAASNGGGAVFLDGNDKLRNTILAGNFSGSEPSVNNIFGNVDTSAASSNNLIGTGGTGGLTAINGNQINVADPRLGALANNGGQTQTHALLADSSAIDAGNNCVVNDSCSPALGSALTTDQRGAGFNRSADGNGDSTATVDIGAFEVQVILVTNTNDTGPGSLRQAITDANVNPDTNAINFQAGLTGTITLLTALPDLSTSMAINGLGANVLTVMRNADPATQQFRIFTVSGASAAQISGLTIRNGLNANGGGILNQSNATLTLTSCAITGNAADFGGGIRNEGRLTVMTSTISGNTASAFAGGGIINRGSAATATIINSTVSANQAGAGGGIFDDGVTTTLTLTNCTITNNTATSPGSASGLHTNNQSNQTPGNAKVGNTIIAGNSGAGPELLGFFTSQGHNLIGVSAGANGFTNGSDGDQVGTSGSPLNARLGVLANNGGPAQTHALLPSSPALNAGSNTLATNAGLTTDQRGFPRITNTTVDIGAFESRGFTIAATSGTPQSVTILTAFGSSLVATVSSAFGEPVAGGSVTFTAPASGASGTFPGSVTTSTATIAANGTATAPLFTANGTAGGPYNVVASLAGGSPSANFALTNLKGNQTITVNTHAPANATYNGQFTVAATASSGLAVTYSSSGACTNSGATFIMTSGTGTCTVKYDQAGDTNYNAATQVTEPVTAQKLNQTITFGALSAKTFGDPDFAVSATTDAAGLTVSFVASGQCTVTAVSPGTVHLAAPGSCTITAKQAGDSNYNAAADVPQAFSIANAVSSTAVSSSLNPSSLSQSVTFTATVSSAVAGTPTGTVQFKDGGANIGSAQTLNGSAQATISTTGLTAGSHVITAVYSGDATYATSTGTLSGGQFVNDAPVISLSQSSYNTSETTGFVTITVNRAGLSGPAVTVDYTTDDTGASNSCANTNSLASSRCDYTTAAGTLHFASGEMQKTFVVVVNQDSYAEGPEVFTVNLANPTGGASLSSPSGATVTIADDSAGLPPNAIDDVDFFVRQQYHDFLSREPDTSGYNFWRNQIKSCGTNAQCIDLKRTNVSAAFFVSVEFQNSGYLVERLYKASYGDGSGMSTCCNTPSHPIPVPVVRFNEFLPDTQAIGRGLIVGAPGWEALLESNTQALIADFVQRQRFLTAFPLTMSTADFVDALNVNAGNPLSQAERDQLVNSGKSRAEILRAVAEDQDLYNAEYNRAFVLMQYFGYLRRNPSDSPEQNLDYTGYDFWLLKLNAKNGNYIKAEMVRSFLVSGEYRQRFGPP